MIFLFLFGALIACTSGAEYYDRIYFPAFDSNRFNKPSHDRVPVIDRQRCRPNEYLYPGDNSYDWTCDCKPGYIFYAKDGLCHEAYRTGPCRDGEIFVLQSSNNRNRSPKCIFNQCGREGLVIFNNQCQQLDSSTPCKIYEYLIGRRTYLSVNPSTFELTCAEDNNLYECNNLCCVNNVGGRECFRN